MLLFIAPLEQLHKELYTPDNGYFSGENLKTLEDSEIDCYVATGKGEDSDGSGVGSGSGKLEKSVGV